MLQVVYLNQEALSVFEDLPPFLTVEQAAKVLQLGRSKTYQLSMEWERSAVYRGCRSSGSAIRSGFPGRRWSGS